MLTFRKTILPLWYIVGILVLVLGSFFLFLGTRYAMQVGDLVLATKLVKFDWMMLGSWFVVNVAVLVWLLIKKALLSDFIYPIYFVLLHGLYAALIIAGEVFGSYAPSWIVFSIGIASSILELFFVFYLFGCYKFTAETICETNLTLDTRKPIVKRTKSKQTSVSKKIKSHTSKAKSIVKKSSSVKKTNRSKKKK